MWSRPHTAVTELQWAGGPRAAALASARERLLDRVLVEEALDRHERGADPSGHLRGVADADLQRPGGQRHRPAVHRLADAGQQREPGLGDAAGHHDAVRIEEVD